MVAHLRELERVRESAWPCGGMYLLHQGGVVDGEAAELAVHLEPMCRVLAEGAADRFPECRQVGAVGRVELGELGLSAWERWFIRYKLWINCLFVHA